MRVEIIAEAGVNHNGKLDLAIRLVDAAKASGADAIKFQTSIPENETTDQAALADYQQAHGYSSQLEMIRAISLSFPDTLKLARHCEAAGIEFMSTAADPVSLQFLIEECGMSRIKIGSDNLTNVQMLNAAAAFAKPVILSTGMSTITDIAAAIALLYDVRGVGALTLMQCTSAYPTKHQDANIAAIETLRRAFPGVPVGFSDHTDDCLASLVAVGAGARIIEKHFTLDPRMKGPDHAMSLSPFHLEVFVDSIRQASLVMGHGEKIPTLEEKANSLVVRKSLVAAREIKAGEEFCADNIAIKRPGIGRSPWDYFELIGKPAMRAYKQDELID